MFFPGAEKGNGVKIYIIEYAVDKQRKSAI